MSSPLTAPIPEGQNATSQYTQTYATASRTIAAATSGTLTDSTGATPNTTIENVPAISVAASALTIADTDIDGTPNHTNVETAIKATVDAVAADIQGDVNTSLTAIENSLSDLAAMCNKLTADVLAMKQNDNAIVNDLHGMGL